MSDRSVYDVVIVGGGPAGLNAALVLGRARRSVALCDAGNPRNAVATEMHGFVTRDGYSPRQLEADARAELRQYPTIELFDASVEDITGDHPFALRLDDGRSLYAKRILLASGMRDELPSIDGIQERWGRSVFVCPHCDGWEFTERRICIAGEQNDVVGLAQELYRWSKQLTLLGVDPKALRDERGAWLAATGLSTTAASASSFEGPNGTITAVILRDGSRVPCDALFLCVPLVQRSRLPERLGCELDGNGSVSIDAEHRTIVPGVFACGDMVARVHQVVVAAGSGVKAAIALNDALLDDEISRMCRSLPKQAR